MTITLNPVRFCPVRFCLTAAILTCSLQLGAGSATAQEVKTNFDDHVKSILRQRCASCHGPDSKKGDLDITNFTSLMLGGSSGTVIEPGDPDGSYLYSLVTHEDEPVMPPGGKIPDAEIALLKKWIELGALENKGSKAVMSKKPTAAAMGENPTVRPEVVATFPRTPLEPVQHTSRNPVSLSIATSPWAPVTAVAGKNQVLLYDTNTLQLTGVLPFPEGSVNVVRFSRSGSVLLAAGGRAGASGVAVLWDVASGERITTVGDELDAVLAADISPDHSLVAMGGSGKVVKVYSTETGAVQQTITKHTDWITSLAFSTDGVLLATGDRNGGLHVWESWTGRAYLTLKGHTASVNSIAWRGDSNVVASASTDTTVRLWELNKGGQIKSWAAHGGGANSIAFTRDGRILSTGVDKVTKLFAADGTQQIAFAAFADVATSAAWCDETSRAIAGDYTGDVRVWKSDDGTQLGTLTANPIPLATRLANAQTNLAESNKLAGPLTTKHAAAAQSAATVQAQLDAARVAKTKAQSAFDEVQAAMAQTNEKTKQIQVQLTAAKSSLTEMNEAKPLLGESLASMTAASQKLPTDEELKAQVATLTQRIAVLETQIAEMNANATTLQASMTELTSQVKATDERVRTSTENMKTTADAVTSLTAQIAPLNQARDAAAAELLAATAASIAAKAEVARWQAEIDFIKQLEQLATRLAEAQTVVGQKQDSLEAANKVLATAQSESNAAKATVDQAQHAANAIRAEIEAARKIPK